MASNVTAVDPGHLFQHLSFSFSIDEEGRKDYLRLFSQVGVPFLIFACAAVGFLALKLRFRLSRVARYVFCVSRTLLF